jgi:hypothetical protein
MLPRSAIDRGISKGNERFAEREEYAVGERAAVRKNKPGFCPEKSFVEPGFVFSNLLDKIPILVYTKGNTST